MEPANGTYQRSAYRSPFGRVHRPLQLPDTKMPEKVLDTQQQLAQNHNQSPSPGRLEKHKSANVQQINDSIDEKILDEVIVDFDQQFANISKVETHSLTKNTKHPAVDVEASNIQSPSGVSPLPQQSRNLHQSRQGSSEKSSSASASNSIPGFNPKTRYSSLGIGSRKLMSTLLVSKDEGQGSVVTKSTAASDVAESTENGSVQRDDSAPKKDTQTPSKTSFKRYNGLASNSLDSQSTSASEESKKTPTTSRYTPLAIRNKQILAPQNTDNDSSAAKEDTASDISSEAKSGENSSNIKSKKRLSDYGKSRSRPHFRVAANIMSQSITTSLVPKNPHDSAPVQHDKNGNDERNDNHSDYTEGANAVTDKSQVETENDLTIQTNATIDNRNNSTTSNTPNRSSPVSMPAGMRMRYGRSAVLKKKMKSMSPSAASTSIQKEDEVAFVSELPTTVESDDIDVKPIASEKSVNSFDVRSQKRFFPTNSNAKASDSIGLQHDLLIRQEKGITTGEQIENQLLSTKLNEEEHVDNSTLHQDVTPKFQNRAGSSTMWMSKDNQKGKTNYDSGTPLWKSPLKEVVSAKATAKSRTCPILSSIDPSDACRSAAPAPLAVADPSEDPSQHTTEGSKATDSLSPTKQSARGSVLQIWMNKVQKPEGPQDEAIEQNSNSEIRLTEKVVVEQERKGYGAPPPPPPPSLVSSVQSWWNRNQQKGPSIDSSHGNVTSKQAFAVLDALDTGAAKLVENGEQNPVYTMQKSNDSLSKPLSFVDVQDKRDYTAYRNQQPMDSLHIPESESISPMSLQSAGVLSYWNNSRSPAQNISKSQPSDSKNITPHHSSAISTNASVAGKVSALKAAFNGNSDGRDVEQSRTSDEKPVPKVANQTGSVVASWRNRMGQSVTSESLDKKSSVQANSIRSSWHGTSHAMDQEAVSTAASGSGNQNESVVASWRNRMVKQFESEAPAEVKTSQGRALANSGNQMNLTGKKDVMNGKTQPVASTSEEFNVIPSIGTVIDFSTRTASSDARSPSVASQIKSPIEKPYSRRDIPDAQASVNGNSNVRPSWKVQLTPERVHQVKKLAGVSSNSEQETFDFTTSRQASFSHIPPSHVDLNPASEKEDDSTLSETLTNDDNETKVDIPLAYEADNVSVASRRNMYMQSLQKTTSGSTVESHTNPNTMTKPAVTALGNRSAKLENQHEIGVEVGVQQRLLCTPSPSVKKTGINSSILPESRAVSSESNSNVILANSANSTYQKWKELTEQGPSLLNDRGGPKTGTLEILTTESNDNELTSMNSYGSSYTSINSIAPIEETPSEITAQSSSEYCNRPSQFKGLSASSSMSSTIKVVSKSTYGSALPPTNAYKVIEKKLDPASLSNQGSWSKMSTTKRAEQTTSSDAISVDIKSSHDSMSSSGSGSVAAMKAQLWGAKPNGELMLNVPTMSRVPSVGSFNLKADANANRFITDHPVHNTTTQSNTRSPFRMVSGDTDATISGGLNPSERFEKPGIFPKAQTSAATEIRDNLENERATNQAYSTNTDVKAAGVRSMTVQAIEDSTSKDKIATADSTTMLRPSGKGSETKEVNISGNRVDELQEISSFREVVNDNGLLVVESNTNAISNASESLVATKTATHLRSIGQSTAAATRPPTSEGVGPFGKRELPNVTALEILDDLKRTTQLRNLRRLDPESEMMSHIVRSTSLGDFQESLSPRSTKTVSTHLRQPSFGERDIVPLESLQRHDVSLQKQPDVDICALEVSPVLGEQVVDSKASKRIYDLLTPEASANSKNELLLSEETICAVSADSDPIQQDITAESYQHSLGLLGLSSVTPKEHRPWIKDKKTLSPELWQRKRNSELGTNDEEDVAIETPAVETQAAMSPSHFLRQMAADSNHAIDYEDALKLVPKQSMSSDEHDSLISGNEFFGLIPSDLPPEFEDALNKRDYAPDQYIIESLTPDGISVVYGDPKAFGAAGGEDQNAPPLKVAARAKALEKWNGGLGVPPRKLDKQEMIRREIGRSVSPIRRTNSMTDVNNGTNSNLFVDEENFRLNKHRKVNSSASFAGWSIDEGYTRQSSSDFDFGIPNDYDIRDVNPPSIHDSSTNINEGEGLSHVDNAWNTNINERRGLSSADNSWTTNVNERKELSNVDNAWTTNVNERKGLPNIDNTWNTNINQSKGLSNIDSAWGISDIVHFPEVNQPKKSSKKDDVGVVFDPFMSSADEEDNQDLFLPELHEQDISETINLRTYPVEQNSYVAAEDQDQFLPKNEAHDNEVFQDVSDSSSSELMDNQILESEIMPVTNHNHYSPPDGDYDVPQAQEIMRNNANETFNVFDPFADAELEVERKQNFDDVKDDVFFPDSFISNDPFSMDAISMASFKVTPEKPKTNAFDPFSDEPFGETTNQSFVPPPANVSASKRIKSNIVPNNGIVRNSYDVKSFAPTEPTISSNRDTGVKSGYDADHSNLYDDSYSNFEI